MSVFFTSRRRHTRFDCDWSSDVCSSDLPPLLGVVTVIAAPALLPSLVAVIVAPPTATAVTRPLPLTVATEASLVDQATARPPNPFPCESLGVAVSCTVCPSAILATAGLTVTQATRPLHLRARDLSHET